jgi:hypothetical protein
MVEQNMVPDLTILITLLQSIDDEAEGFDVEACRQIPGADLHTTLTENRG